MQELINVSNLCKKYKRSSSLFYTSYQHAFGPVNFSLDKGQTLSIIGDNGSGKSSLVDTIAGLTKPTSGQIYIKGRPISSLSKVERCKTIRMIFNDPSNSLDPKAKIGDILEVPLKLNTDLNAPLRYAKIRETLILVDLLPDYIHFYPHMLSADQQHKVALARAMILNPDLIIADEILSTLDISIRFKILNLLIQFQKQRGLSFIFIAQDMALIRHISDKVIVMHDGNIIEQNTTEQLFNYPQMERTKLLIQNHQPELRK